MPQTAAGKLASNEASCRHTFAVQYSPHRPFQLTLSGQSNVGNRQVYEAGDQRNPKASETGSGTRYHEGTANAHLQNDSSMSASRGANFQSVANGPSEDQRSLSNRAAAEVSRLNGNLACCLTACD